MVAQIGSKLAQFLQVGSGSNVSLSEVMAEVLQFDGSVSTVVLEPPLPSAPKPLKLYN